jgi:hypothetical protein
VILIDKQNMRAFLIKCWGMLQMIWVLFWPFRPTPVPLSEKKRREYEQQIKSKALPLPGEMIISNEQSPSDASRSTLKIVSFNIERGYFVPEIIARLKQVDADILLIQELDWGNERTKNLDVCKVGMVLPLLFAAIHPHLTYPFLSVVGNCCWPSNELCICV